MNCFKSVGLFLLTAVLVLSVQSMLGSQDIQGIRERYKKAATTDEKYAIASEFLSKVKNKQELLGFYEPTAERCGAATRAGSSATDSLVSEYDSTVGGLLACLVSGKKFLGFMEGTMFLRGVQEDLQGRGLELTDKTGFAYLPDGVKRIMKESKIGAFFLKGKGVLMYVPVGEDNAFLLTKWSKTNQKTNQDNFYLTGTLLGYLEKDIAAFYLRSFDSRKTAQELFVKHKQEALAWIRENEAGIKQWAAQQSDIRILPIEFSQQPSAAESESKKKEGSSHRWEPDTEDSL